MVSAGVRIDIISAMLDNFGTLTEEAQRQLRGLLCDLPPGAPLTIYLGPLRQVDYLLLAELLVLPAGRDVTFEGPRWRLVASYCTALNDALDEVTA